MYYNSKKGKGKPAKKTSDFMLFMRAWSGNSGKYVSDDDVNDDINTIIDAFGLRDSLVIDRSAANGEANRQS